MDSRLAAVFDVRAVNNRQYIVFGQARLEMFLQGLASHICEIPAPSEVTQLFLASHSADSTECRAELDKLSFRKKSLQLRDMTIGHPTHADQTDSTLGQVSLADGISQRWDWSGAIPAHVFYDALRLSTGLMVEKMDEHRGCAFPREQ